MAVWLAGWLVGSVDTHVEGGLKMNLMSHCEGALWWLSSELGGDFPGRMLQPQKEGWLGWWETECTAAEHDESNRLQEIHVWMQWTVTPSVALRKTLISVYHNKKYVMLLQENVENFQWSAPNTYICYDQLTKLYFSSESIPVSKMYSSLLDTILELVDFGLEITQAGTVTWDYLFFPQSTKARKTLDWNELERSDCRIKVLQHCHLWSYFNNKPGQQHLFGKT